MCISSSQVFFVFVYQSKRLSFWVAVLAAKHGGALVLSGRARPRRQRAAARLEFKSQFLVQFD